VTAVLDPRIGEYARRVDAALERWLPPADQPPARLHAAMRYASLDGGKRLRAALVYAAAEAVGARPEAFDAPACAIELIHAYSLVHDDLPAMDDDDLRRGKPSCHLAFGEGTAILAGDAIQTLAFQVLARDPHLPVGPQRRLEMLASLADAAGSAGMAGGQGLDLEAVGRQLDLEALETMHRLKTGGLIRCAVRLGALGAAGISEALLEALDRYAIHLGLAFQIIDDVLDEEGDPATLGKNPGSDRAQGKPSYVALLGVDGARGSAERHAGAALAALDALTHRAGLLRSLARFAVERRS
jgi:geranylgeranyl diphosphate synthase, type II